METRHKFDFDVAEDGEVIFGVHSEWYRAKDYEALQARLAEAERRLGECSGGYETLQKELTLARQENERLRNEVNARKDSPVTRLHNICAAIGDMRKDSPFSQEAWDMQEEQNNELQKELVRYKRALQNIEENGLHIEDRIFATKVLNENVPKGDGNG